jgi:hypothetical protein
MIHPTSKTFLAVASVCVFLLAQACASGVTVKVYNSNPAKGGLVRAQANEIIRYEDSKGFKCLNNEDAKTLFNDYVACKRLCQ